jgi:rhomboid protease GluP
MAFSIPAKYKEEISTDGKSKTELIKIALETANALDWATKNITDRGFTALVGFSMASFSEIIKIEASDNSLRITSSCVGIQMFDWGKNKKNVNAFKTQLNKSLN